MEDPGTSWWERKGARESWSIFGIFRKILSNKKGAKELPTQGLRNLHIFKLLFCLELSEPERPWATSAQCAGSKEISRRLACKMLFCSNILSFYPGVKSTAPGCCLVLSLALHCCQIDHVFLNVVDVELKSNLRQRRSGQRSAPPQDGFLARMLQQQAKERFLAHRVMLTWCY